ncbi:MAG TPA: hypothetical protein VGO56_07085 [Pyrinomonadaceae bacterium]|jgi:hypothetical protein|nr:hypothetical protein [Pyrinomonadaceae bacterium]
MFDLQTFTHVHVAISLVAILSGLVVVLGLLTNRGLDHWTSFFLLTTAATSVTGFFFPFHGFTPAIGVGIVSLLILTLTIFARYGRHLLGRWRWLFVIGATLSLYLNVFVLIVQLFENVPAFQALAPTQSEPPFLAAQLLTLVLFVVLGILATIRFQPESIRPN